MFFEFKEWRKALFWCTIFFPVILLLKKYSGYKKVFKPLSLYHYISFFEEKESLVLKLKKLEKVLLHCCCAPCSAPIIEWMLNNGISFTLFFFNPNIYPREEYLRRKEECINYANSQKVDFIDGDYDHNSWLEKIQGLEEEPERGQRCLKCFKIRLAATAMLAAEQGFSVITTTLAGSRWKSFGQIVEAGNWATSFVEGISFWDKDWKKGGLTERRRELLRENNFYNQLYCGCEFSIRK